MTSSSSLNSVDSMSNQMNKLSVDDRISKNKKHSENQVMNKEQTLNKFKEKMNEIFTPEIIVNLKTIKGNTQVPERNYIQLVSNGLKELNFDYKEAGSQQSKDFRNINNTGLNIEVKKTDKFIIKCNDTCPSKDIDYLIIFTGVNYKTKENIKPQILFINGQQIIEECNWLSEYQKDIEYLKNKYCRGENKKNLDGAISVYVRPNYDVDIRKLNLNLN